MACWIYVVTCMSLTHKHLSVFCLLQPLSLISDFGGQCGLWLGLSMVAVFELFELIMDLIIICAKRCKARRERQAQVGTGVVVVAKTAFPVTSS